MYYWREVCFSKLVGPDSTFKNRFKQVTLTVHGLIFRRVYLISEGCLHLRFGDQEEEGGRGAYFWRGFYSDIYGTS